MNFGGLDIIEASTIEQFATPTSQAAGLGFRAALADNPITGRGLDYYELSVLDAEPGGALIKQKDAQERLAKAGAALPVGYEKGIPQASLEFLEDRAYEKNARDFAISRLEGGLTSTALLMGGGLIGSMFDPANVAAGMLPVPGVAERMTARLATTSGVLGRAAVRATYGGIESAIVDAAVLEPLNHALAGSLGDEYTAADSLMNIAAGAILGGGLHAAGGWVADALAPATFKRFGGKGFDPEFVSAREAVQALHANGRHDLLYTALAQTLQDQPLDLDAVLEAHAIVTAGRGVDPDAPPLRVTGPDSVPLRADAPDAPPVARLAKAVADALETHPGRVVLDTPEGRLVVEALAETPEGPTLRVEGREAPVSLEALLEAGEESPEILELPTPRASEPDAEGPPAQPLTPEAKEAAVQAAVQRARESAQRPPDSGLILDPERVQAERKQLAELRKTFDAAPQATSALETPGAASPLVQQVRAATEADIGALRAEFGDEIVEAGLKAAEADRVKTDAVTKAAEAFARCALP